MLFSEVTVIQADGGLLSKAYVGIRDGRVAYLGTQRPAGDWGEELRGELLLIPGFFNSHTHVPMTLLRGYGDDMTGCPYYNQKGEKLNLTEIALLDAVDGIAVAYDWVTHKRFYIDESGKQCIADSFDGADAFLDGYAVVQKAVTGADGKEDVEWGIIKR